MAESKKNNVAIWKLRNDLLVGESQEQRIQEIIDQYNTKEKEKAEQKGYKAHELTPCDLHTKVTEDRKLLFYRKQRYSKNWAQFLDSILSQAELNEIYYAGFDLLGFIFNNESIYVITAGAGYHCIQEYVDENFSFEIAKSLLIGEFDASDTREFIGTTYLKSENYRKSHGFNRQDAIGKIWKRLTGKLDSNVLLNTNLSDFINPEKKHSAEIKGSFTLRKNITFVELVKLINSLEKLPKPDSDKASLFSFLDSLREVKKTKLKEALRKELVNRLYKNITQNEHIFLDFCHPKLAQKFYSATQYLINGSETNFEDYPTAEQVLAYIKTKGLVTLRTLDEFLDSLDRIDFSFDDDEGVRVSDVDFIKYFHGEISYEGAVYFLIDGVWFEAIGNFLENLKENFIETVFDKDLLTKAIPFIGWNLAIDEGKYNKSFIGKDGFFYGDKIFLKYSKGKIEIFDLLYVNKNEVFIIQVKDGFDAAIRDACSQIEMAAEYIEDPHRDNLLLEKYFEEFKIKNNTSMSKDEFLGLLNPREKKLYYVVACSTPQSFTSDEFKSGKHLSHIAKYEILGTNMEFRGRGWNFLIAHITKSA